MAATRHPFLEVFVVGPVAENAYILRDPVQRKAAIIDPGGFTPEIREAMKGYEVVAIFLTHAHFDHLLGLREAKEATSAPIYMNPKEQIVFDRHPEVVWEYIKQKYNAPQPDREYREGDTMQVGDIKLKVVEAPGHTPGHVILVGDGFALVGDVIFQGSIGRTDFPGGNLPTLLDSIKNKVATLPPATVLYSGHGAETTVQDELDRSPFMRAALGDLRVL